MDCQELRALAIELETGAAADIWYDADSFGDDCDKNYQEQIEKVQEAMTRAARFLKALAELIE